MRTFPLWFVDAVTVLLEVFILFIVQLTDEDPVAHFEIPVQDVLSTLKVQLNSLNALTINATVNEAATGMCFPVFLLFRLTLI